MGGYVPAGDCAGDFTLAAQLANVPFPLSLGADGGGSTRLNLLRFSQDYLQRSPRHVLAGRSQLSLGWGRPNGCGKWLWIR
jgi:hypothetical protein